MQINIRSSCDSFRKLREYDSYYVDKTKAISTYLEKHVTDAVLFTRPRRFGKSVMMTMFRDFLDIRQDSGKIFQNLEIMSHPDIVKDYMNKYPVIFLSLKEVHGDNFSDVLESLQTVLSTVCKQNVDLLDSEKVDSADKEILNALRHRRGERKDMVEALSLLARMLHAHFKKPVFVIIDEYDVPIARAYGTADYDKVRNLIENLLSYVCKTNEDIVSVLLSGCLYTVKNSAYTGVNNIISYTVLSPGFDDAFGFTDEEVQKLLEDAGLPDIYDTVEEWYDGYIFGNKRIYCPWDVLSFVNTKLDGSYDEEMGPESYWLNTSETSQNIIHGFLGKTNNINEQFERLLTGATVECKVNEFVPYHLIHENGDNLWSALLETGYLTKATKGKMRLIPLRIPNRGIQEVFRQEVWDYFNDKVDNAFVSDLVNAMWASEISIAEAALNQILESTLSFYHEYHEYSYHLILDGFFTGCGYQVQSERETGYGRSDLIILDTVRRRSMILELKHVKKEEEMEPALNEAKSQIIEKKYESQLIYEGYTERLRYGMSFFNKRCLIGFVQ